MRIKVVCVNMKSGTLKMVFLAISLSHLIYRMNFIYINDIYDFIKNFKLTKIDFIKYDQYIWFFQKQKILLIIYKAFVDFKRF